MNRSENKLTECVKAGSSTRMLPLIALLLMSLAPLGTVAAGDAGGINGPQDYGSSSPAGMDGTLTYDDLYPKTQACYAAFTKKLYAQIFAEEPGHESFAPIDSYTSNYNSSFSLPDNVGVRAAKSNSADAQSVTVQYRVLELPVYISPYITVTKASGEVRSLSADDAFPYYGADSTKDVCDQFDSNFGTCTKTRTIFLGVKVIRGEKNGTAVGLSGPNGPTGFEANSEEVARCLEAQLAKPNSSQQ